MISILLSDKALNELYVSINTVKQSCQSAIEYKSKQPELYQKIAASLGCHQGDLMFKLFNAYGADMAS